MSSKVLYIHKKEVSYELKKKNEFFLELQREIKAGLEAYERGEAIPLEEVIAKLNSTN